MIIPQVQYQVNFNTCTTLCSFVVFFHSTHKPHTLFTLYLFSTNTKKRYLYGGMEMTWFQWFIMRLYSQINSSGPLWIAWKAPERSAPRVRNQGLMLAVRRAHQQRVRELCVVHFSPNTGIAFWTDARRNEKWWACFYVNWLLSAHPRPVIRELTIRRNKPRTRRNSIKASHLSLISQCMGEIRNSQMCGDTEGFDLCTSYCQPSWRNCSFSPNIILVLGDQPEDVCSHSS